MKNTKLLVVAASFALMFSSFAHTAVAQTAPAKTSSKKKSVTTTKTETVTEEPQATPTPAPETESEKTTGEKIQDAAQKTAEGIQDAAKQVGEQLGQTAGVRAQSDMVVVGTYAPIDLVIPSKLGLSIGWIGSVRNTLELEYLKGTVKMPLVEDLGEVADTRISLMRRSYFSSNSFNFSYGVSYMGFKGKIGDALLSRLTSGAVPNIELVAIESFGLTFGLGNRWIFSRGITFGIDWFTWSQPLVVTKKEAKFLDYVSNQNDKDNIQKAVDLISILPHLSILKLQLGMTF